SQCRSRGSDGACRSRYNRYDATQQPHRVSEITSSKSARSETARVVAERCGNSERLRVLGDLGTHERVECLLRVVDEMLGYRCDTNLRCTSSCETATAGT